MCVELTHTNTNDFYRFDDKTCLKIKNNKVSLPLGFIGDEQIKVVKFMLNSVYIKVNINNNRKMTFIDKYGNEMSTELDYVNNNLLETDMNICD